MQISGVMERQGGPLLDQEALASILVLLFIDDPNVSTLRFYRVIKNLCYHVPTRKWIIRALLSIVQKCSEELVCGTKAIESSETTKPDWLNVRLDSALSCRTSVFVMRRPSISGGTIKKYDSPITVHPKASPIVCRHTIDLLIFLAKSFPVHFLPLKKTDAPSTSGGPNAPSTSTAMTTLATASIAIASKPKSSKNANTSSSSSSSGIASLKKDEQPSTSSGSTGVEKSFEFWEILGTLDSKISHHRKIASASGNCPKPTNKPVKEFTEPDVPSFEVSPFAQLIKILGHETVKNSSQLTDKVLRLLSLVSVALPDSKNKTGTSSLVRKPPQNQQVKQLFDDSNQVEAEHHLRVIVQVLTSKACSEDGLEDATTLLINLSKCSNRTRYVIHSQLLDGAYAVSRMVLKHIDDLMKELRQFKQNARDRTLGVGTDAAVATTSAVSATTTNSVDDDVELMASSAASQDPTSANYRSNRGVLQDRFTREAVIITAASKVKATCDLQLPSMAPLVSKTSSQAFFLRILKVITQIRDSVYQTMKNEINNTQKTVEPNHLELSPLSETLKLDTLWDTLSECLKELEETTDHHAVLVLQPTVEAFFLVHASNNHKNACALLKQKEQEQQEEEQQTQQQETEAETASTNETAALDVPTPEIQAPEATSATAAPGFQPPVPGVSASDSNALSLSLEPLPFSSSTSAVSSNNITPSLSVDGVSAMESTPSDTNSVPAASSITGNYNITKVIVGTPNTE